MRIHNEADWQLQESGLIENIITFNGQGSAGKSTQAKRLVKIRSGLYTYVLAHALRDDFKKNFYDQLNRPEQLGIEVLGFPSLPWLTAYFHWQLKPILLNGSILVFDHYLGDHYADMLPSGSAEKFQNFVKNSLGIPDFDHGIHFYLDVDYCTYREREKERTEKWTEPEGKDNFNRRRDQYKELCKLGYLECIDATMCKDAVAEKIQKIVAKKFDPKRV